MLIIHYHRYDGDYEQASIWTWDATGVRQPEHPEVLFSGETDYGVYFALDPERYGTGGEDVRIGFLPRLRRDWRLKDGTDRYWTPELGREVWLIGENGRIFTERPDISPLVTAACVDGTRLLMLRLSHPVDVMKLRIGHLQITDREGVRQPVSELRPRGMHNGEARTLEAELARPLDLTRGPFSAGLDGFRPARAQLRRVLDDPEHFLPLEPMGVQLFPARTTFRIFAPTAEAAEVRLQRSLDSGSERRRLPMRPGGRGEWLVEAPGNLEGWHYRLAVENPDRDPVEVNDPWAVNTVGDHNPARITDVRALDPEGFRPVQRPAWGRCPTDAIIYELSVRDATIDPNSGVEENWRGKFLGLARIGTRHPEFPQITTGLDHLRELGITHVQLLPAQDFDNDEANPWYNWGYMTAFFNSPEGWYATDYKTEARVREFKEMVKALHDAGIAVIMDVVYNHTGTQATFEAVAPHYFHRVREDGSFWNGSGTGNEFRSESPMGRRFIVESCRYWLEEMGVDGFRFDLMALIDRETLLAVQDELRGIYPQVLIYGEPWAATGPDGSGLKQLVYKDQVAGTGIGAFNDHYRNALKGEPEGADPGYVQNGSRREEMKRGIAGSIDDWARHPTDSVNYGTCHDNLTLWDKLVLSAPGLEESDYRAMVRLTGAILAVSQGMMFLHAGCEMARTKGGHHNSYDAGDDVNRIDWTRKEAFADLAEYHAGLIAIRRAHPVLRLRRAEDVRARLRFRDDLCPVPECICFFLEGDGLNGETWQTAMVAINPTPDALEFPLPIEHAQVYILAKSASATSLGPAGEGKLLVPARSLALVAR